MVKSLITLAAGEEGSSRVIKDLTTDKNNLLVIKEELEEKLRQASSDRDALNSQVESGTQQNTGLTALKERLDRENADIQDKCEELDVLVKELNTSRDEGLEQLETAIITSEQTDKRINRYYMLNL